MQQELTPVRCLADAWHHRSDAFSSVGALTGIAGARLGFPVMDSIASLVIFLFIMKAAYDIFKDAVNKVVDHSCDEVTERQIYERVMTNEAVMGIDSLHTRIFGNKIYIDIEIAVDGSYTLKKSHGIAEEVHEDIEKNFQKVKHIMVHVNSAHEAFCQVLISVIDAKIFSATGNRQEERAQNAPVDG